MPAYFKPNNASFTGAKTFLLAPAFAGFFLASSACAQNTPAAPPATTVAGPATLTLDLAQAGVTVSPTLYGLMTEEINHSYDGGLYAELIQNRSFKDDTTTPLHWSPVQGTSAIALDESQPINEALTTSLKLTATVAGDGIANDGYWGIPLKPQTTYRASFYARTDAASSGPLSVSIQNSDGTTNYAQAQVTQVTNQWQRYTVSLTTDKNVPTTAATRFVISTSKPGTFWFNLVSLFPPTFNSRPNGNRADIMGLMAGMKPTFLRLPGGNYLEGETIDTRFPWKKTLGDISERPGHPGTWRYRSSDGMGLLEYLEWCEDLKVQPVLAVYAGYSLKGDHVEPGPALQPFVDEALEEIEYVIGDATTKWGAVRAKNGHPAPFPLTYVEIGNEDGFDKSGTYDGRYTQFSDAIKAKYPQLQVISTVGGKDGLGQRQKVTSRKLDIVDEHYYRNAGEMQGDAAHYDNYSRTGPKVFVGEWATREGAPTTNLNAALGDAAWMTGMERNSDIVIMSCYAPLFVNVNRGGMQWPSDLIGFDAQSSYGSPSYYAQKMFGTYLGDRVVPATLGNVPMQTWQPPARRNRPAQPPRQLPTLFAVATRASKSGTVFLKVVNSGATEQRVQISLNGAAQVATDGISVVLSSPSPDDTNTITEPTKIVPITSKINGLGRSFTRAFAPYSINVLQIETK
ncbi:extracellular exo-alpha-L-arabinofuranosidase [Abditibacteriota bacterium]|nr:extracellular exo-alpha-L-arabinofuranosidase [Abditibacteriota bacterium]